MEVDIIKCGMMSASHSSMIGKVISNNMEVERVDKYKYLGVELNESLDFKAIGDHRIGIGYQTVDTTNSFLLNQTIPPIFKRMLIRTVLIPRIKYGIDMLGSRLNNPNTMRKVINNSLRMINKNFNICISAAQNELNIMPIEAYVRQVLERLE